MRSTVVVARWFLAPGLVLLLGMPLAGQGARIGFGVMGGLAVANLHGSDVDPTLKSRTGFTAGVFLSAPIARNFTLEPQVLYVQKGTRAEASGVTATAKLDYLEVPLLLKLVFPMSGSNAVAPSIFVAPAVGFRISCKADATGGGGSASVTCGDAGVSVKSTDFSAAAGVGLDIGAFVIQGRYDYGLVKIGDYSQPADVKTGAWLFTLGYRFGGGR
jgi:hypothetical protein